MAPRLPGDVGRLRAYGNAIVPPLAARFVEAVIEVLDAAVPGCRIIDPGRGPLLATPRRP
ncbi:MAG: hypothetical protein ABIG85_05405 [Chloroflexota bacterium]